VDNGVRRVVLTGGEPLLQVDVTLLKRLAHEQFKIHIETNGAIPDVSQELFTELILNCEQLVVSPKNTDVSHLVILAATTLKVLYPFPGMIDQAYVLDLSEDLGTRRDATDPRYRILQPVTPIGGVWSKENANEYGVTCRQAVGAASKLTQAAGDEWRVLPQTHVMMGLR